ncbi:type II toxin-antitoxin system HipA family toxin [Pseudomonas sp. WS 5018]|uniref:type II toxin-antitoxin system HipA family toxin n=1 Tax=Stutzerimonas stutzeri TaxID=316 RepID=UPI000EE31A9B|nr:type II toxin-antitoxin system HipA family toxin [Stutzerimonas stutzeri]MDH1555666.1 type II toxin-antitoxin system HipA family toxin [Stutzerimonas stutzeri]NMY64927.1 type II toxin-antitoxin system HipA family toxin [Pseudomonas sp. WS 5018]HAB85624.1 phosphatidylinositol kinase [Pseudomonas sp.]
MTAVLQVATPEGGSGRILSSGTDYLFRYHEDAKAQAAISLLMPVRLDEYRHRELHPIFQMNLPEGYVLEQLRNRLAKVANVDPMLLLALSGSSSPIGRVAVSSPEVDALLRRQQFPGEKLEEILAWDGAEDIFAGLVDRYILRAGISGVQPKVLVPEHQSSVPQRFTSKTSDLIIKSGRDEFPGLAINEFLCMSVAKEVGIAVPEFYLSDNAKLFVMRRFDRDKQLNPIGFEDMAALMGLAAEQKYSKSYSAIAKAIRLFCAPEQVQESLAQLFAIVTLSCIVGNGDAHLKNFGLLYSDPTQRDARLAPAYDIVNTTAYIPEDVLALDLVGNKSLFASRQGLLDFAQVCDVVRPEEVIRGQLSALERVLARSTELREQAPHVVEAIRHCAEPFMKTFG